MELLAKVLINLFDAIIGVIFVTSFTKAGKLKGKNIIIVSLAMVAMFISFPYYDSDMYLNSIRASLFMGKWSLYRSLFRLCILSVVSFTCGRSSVLLKIACPIIFESISYFVNSTYFMLLISDFLNYPAVALAHTMFTTLMTVSLEKLIMSSILFFLVKIVTYEGKYPIMTILTYVLSPIFSVFSMYLFFKVMFYRTSEYNLEILIAVIGTVGISILSFYMFGRSVKSEAENSKLQLYMSKAEMERTRYTDLVDINREINATKHDLRNSFITIRKYAEEGDTEAIIDYLGGLDKSISNIGSPIVTGNSMLDFLITSKMNGRRDITFAATGVVDDLSVIDEVDLAVLVGNLIDNAIEAVEALDSNEKVIEFNFSVFNGYNNIIIKNDIRESVLETNTELVTTKEDKGKHGFGMKSIRNIVSKYRGLIDCYEKDRKFCVHIAIPCGDR